MRALATNLTATRQQRRALIKLEPDHQHRLHVELGLVERGFSVAEATALAEALTAVPAATALVLLTAFAPGFRDADFQPLLGALEAFEEECAADDNRPSPRWRGAVKQVRL